MRRGDRVIVLPSLTFGEIDSVAGDGRLLVWLDGRTGDAEPTPIPAMDLELCDIPDAPGLRR